MKGVGWDNCAIGNGLLSFGLLHKFWIVYDREYFHQTENFSNTFTVFGHQKHHQLTKRVFDHQKHRQSQREHGTMRTLCLDGRYVSRMGHQGPRGRQILSLTPCNTFRPNDCHILRGCQVPSLTPCNRLRPDSRHVSRGRQVPSLTPRNTFRYDGHHISRGHQVPSLTPCDTLLPDSRHISMGC